MYRDNSYRVRRTVAAKYTSGSDRGGVREIERKGVKNEKKVILITQIGDIK